MTLNTLNHDAPGTAANRFSLFGLVSLALLALFAAGCGREQGALAPVLSAISPSQGTQGATIAATLTGANFANGATVNVGGAGLGVSQTVVVSSGEITATFAIAANAPLGAAEISVTSAGRTTGAVAFTIVAPLAVTATAPGNGATGLAVKPAALTAEFNQPVNCSTVTAATFTMVTPTGGAVPGSVSCSGSSVAFTPAANLADSTVYTLSLSNAILSQSNTALASAYVWSVKTGTGVVATPGVIATVPAPGATGVPFNQQVLAAFNQAMNPATINAASFTLAGPGGTAVAGAVVYDAAGSVASFAPAAPLAANTVYAATITAAASSLGNQALAANYTWSFTTGAAPNTTKPAIVSTIAANGATAVPLNQAVSATFSQSMAPGTITAGNFTLTGPGGTAVAGLVSYAVIAQTATFTPIATLQPNTVYTATITAGAQDLAGNALGAGAAPNPWTFTTAAAAAAVAPTIVAANPSDASSNAAVNASVNATFSQVMDPLTLATFQLTNTATGVAVPGTVAYDPATSIATYTPTSPLTAGATYTATITSGATNLAGKALVAGAVPNPWNFTIANATLPAVNLGTAATFGGFGGGAGMTNQGLLTVINGNIGTTGASTLMTGFHDPGPGCTYTETPLNVGLVNGGIYTAAPPPTVGCPTEGTAATMAIATQAAADALTAFNATSPALMPPTVAAQASELGGLTLPPGVYQSASGSFSITNGDLVLDAQGNANAVWVFQAATSLTVGIAGPTGARNVILINGAQAKNVYWHVGSAATINAAGGGTMVGTILAQSGVSFSTAGNVALTTLDGRALTLTGPVTMVNTVINVPLP
jgi:hypothetical protein